MKEREELTSRKWRSQKEAFGGAKNGGTFFNKESSPCKLLVLVVVSPLQSCAIEGLGGMGQLANDSLLESLSKR